jgi:hypothetical protein
VGNAYDLFALGDNGYIIVLEKKETGTDQHLNRRRIYMFSLHAPCGLREFLSEESFVIVHKLMRGRGFDGVYVVYTSGKRTH